MSRSKREYDKVRNNVDYHRIAWQCIAMVLCILIWAGLSWLCT